MPSRAQSWICCNAQVMLPTFGTLGDDSAVAAAGSDAAGAERFSTLAAGRGKGTALMPVGVATSRSTCMDPEPRKGDAGLGTSSANGEDGVGGVIVMRCELSGVIPRVSDKGVPGEGMS